MQHLSLLTAGWSYIPAGLSFGYLLMLPIPGNLTFNGIYRETMYWPFIVTIIMLLISVALTNGLKLNYRKCQFVHFYINLAAAVFYLCAGLVFLLVQDVVPAIYLAACGLGLTLIPGLSYTHIRAPGRWRAFYMALCYFWFLAGVGGTATIFLHDRIIWSTDKTSIDQTVHQNVAISLLASAGFVVVLVAVNEMLQREGIVDYKKPLDFDTDIAHESGKLMNQGPRRNLYNNFTTTVPATVDNGGMPKQWNASTEQIIMGGRDTKGKNWHVLWTICMIFTKLQGFVAFYWIFVAFGIQYTMLMFNASTVGYTIYWFTVIGSLIGMLAMLVLSPKIVFVLASILHTVGLILAVSFYSTGAGYIHMGVSFVVFNTFIGVSLVIPAINILELSPLNFNESFLAIGSIFELIAIALMQYFAVTDVRLFGLDPISGFPALNHKDVIAAHFIGMIVLSVILQVIVLWHMPNTYKKSLAEINSDLSRMTSYFAFSRTMVPIDNRAAAARTFTESLATEQLEIEEKQLSTRNGHVATRFGAERSDDSTGRRSPYNDFSETRYYRRTIVEREVSPVPDREDPYLQEQLQRQHERNYILSRQQHQHQRARESPDPQQYNYRQDRQSDNRFQQRYLSDPDDFHQDHPRSSGSQPSHRQSHAPHLLSRQQYYEQYAQEHPDPAPAPAPIRKLSPVPRQPSISPIPIVETVTQPAIPRSQISQTIKSEPGYVGRPRLLQTQKSEAPAPPPLPPADYLTKSLPRIKPDRGEPRRESIHPVLVPKPPKPEEEIVPGVEYVSNLRPSEFLRQSRAQSAMYRNSGLLT